MPPSNLAKIIFDLARSDGCNYDIWITNSDGTREVATLEDETNKLYGIYFDGKQIPNAVGLTPTISPDEKEIIYEKDKQLFRQGIDSDKYEQITSDGAKYYSPKYIYKGPYKGKIVAVREIDNSCHLFLMEPNGNIIRQLTNDGLYKRNLRVRPDGRELALGVDISIRSKSAVRSKGFCSLAPENKKSHTPWLR